mmetsp:Transcript_986/g.1632  ORF Transcript_986/g.1632 Transcript_986/m.1632 type:complete len:106 (-) Transcript_986:327-644(-)
MSCSSNSTPWLVEGCRNCQRLQHVAHVKPSSRYLGTVQGAPLHAQLNGSTPEGAVSAARAANASVPAIVASHPTAACSDEQILFAFSLCFGASVKLQDSPISGVT